MNLNFQIKVLLLAFGITVVLSLFIIPILKKLKVGQNERDDGPQSHMRKQGTPTMGGIIMVISIVVCTIGGFLYYTKQEAKVAENLIPLVLASIGFGLIGFIDDFKKVVLKNTKGLRPMHKMLGLTVIAVAFTLYLNYALGMGTDIIIPFLKTSIELPIWFYIPFTVFVMLAVTNAINLTDGIDGLATGITTIILTTLTVISIIFDIKEVTVFGSIAVGTCLGFLIFNLHRAKVFMGDTGSLMLGGVVAVIAIYLKMPLLLIMIAIIPVLETISVMLQVMYYKKTGNRIFKMAPLHHHFELLGWKENKVLVIFCSITLLVCIFSLYVI